MKPGGGGGGRRPTRPSPPTAAAARRASCRTASSRTRKLPPVQRVALSVQRDLDAGLMVVFAVLTMFHSGICSTIFNTFNCSINYKIDDGQGSKRTPISRGGLYY